jgi:putative redox protein
MKTTLDWQKDMHFKINASTGHEIEIDAGPEFGGNNIGTRPKEMVLQGLMGCTAMDVVSILTKMKVKIDSFSMEAEATLSEKHPKVFTHVHLKYILTGDIPEDKLDRAIKMSEGTYCGVSAMLKNGGTEITWEKSVN